MSRLYKIKKTTGLSSGGVRKETDPRLGPMKEGSLKRKPLERFTLEKQQRKLKEKVARSVMKISENLLTPEQKQRKKQIIEELSRGVNQEEPRDITTDVLTGQSVIRPSKSQLAKIAKQAEEELEKRRLPTAVQKLEEVLKDLPKTIADNVAALVAVGAPPQLVADEIEKVSVVDPTATTLTPIPPESGVVISPKKKKKEKAVASAAPEYYTAEDVPEIQDVIRELDRVQQRIDRDPRFRREGEERLRELESRRDLYQSRLIPETEAGAAAQERALESKYRGRSNPETRLAVWQFLRSRQEPFSNERQAILAVKDFQDRSLQSGNLQHSLAEKTIKSIIQEDAPFAVKTLSRQSSVSSETSTASSKGKPSGSGLKLIKEEKSKKKKTKVTNKPKNIKRFGL